MEKMLQMMILCKVYIGILKVCMMDTILNKTKGDLAFARPPFYFVGKYLSKICPCYTYII